MGILPRMLAYAFAGCSRRAAAAVRDGGDVRAHARDRRQPVPARVRRAPEPLGSRARSLRARRAVAGRVREVRRTRHDWNFGPSLSMRDLTVDPVIEERFPISGALALYAALGGRSDRRRDSACSARSAAGRRSTGLTTVAATLLAGRACVPLRRPLSPPTGHQWASWPTRLDVHTRREAVGDRSCSGSPRPVTSRGLVRRGRRRDAGERLRPRRPREGPDPGRACSECTCCGTRSPPSSPPRCRVLVLLVTGAVLRRGGVRDPGRRRLLHPRRAAAATTRW